MGFELGYLADGDVEILVPNIYGQEAARLKGGGGPATRSKWTQVELLSTLDDVADDVDIGTVRQLIAESERRGVRLVWGTGAYPSVSVWSVYADSSGPTAPRVSINFGSLRKALDTSELQMIRDRIASLPGLETRLPKMADDDFNRYPAVALAEVVSSGLVGHLASVIDELTAGPASPSGSD